MNAKECESICAGFDHKDPQKLHSVTAGKRESIEGSAHDW
jgi:hypothetical protein